MVGAHGRGTVARRRRTLAVTAHDKVVAFRNLPIPADVACGHVEGNDRV